MVTPAFLLDFGARHRGTAEEICVKEILNIPDAEPSHSFGLSKVNFKLLAENKRISIAIKMGDAKPNVLTKLPVVSTCNDALFKCFEPFTSEEDKLAGGDAWMMDLAFGDFTEQHDHEPPPLGHQGEFDYMYVATRARAEQQEEEEGEEQEKPENPPKRHRRRGSSSDSGARADHEGLVGCARSGCSAV
jgi:hypothetical protein